MRSLLTEDDLTAMYRAWLKSDIFLMFKQSFCYPYTSLRYHTLFIPALLRNYRNGHEFAGLLLVVDHHREIVPHRTVHVGADSTLRINESAGG